MFSCIILHGSSKSSAGIAVDLIQKQWGKVSHETTLSRPFLKALTPLSPAVYAIMITATGSIQRLFVKIVKRLLVFVVPISVLAAACFLVPRVAGISPGRQELFLLSPYLITALGMYLSIHFHRGRPFMALLLLVVFYWCSRRHLVGRSLELGLNEIYQAFVLLIPANIALIAVMRERGVFSPAGRVRFLFLAVQMFIAFWFFRYNFIASLPVIAADFGLPAFMTPDLVPQPAMIAGWAAFILIAALAVRRQTPVDAGLLGALTAFFIACNWITTPDAHAAFSSAGALILTLSVLRDSYNMAFRDDLTNLPSRRSLNESMSGLGRRYALAMLDVDHFKKFNDTYGHDVGDQVLKMVAQKIMDVGGGARRSATVEKSSQYFFRGVVRRMSSLYWRNSEKR